MRVGEIKPNRPARLTVALSVFAVAGALLTSCASVRSAGSVATPTETASVAASPSVAATSTAPTETPTVSATPVASDAASKGSVDPFVTSATATSGGIDVGALVPTVVESDGTCTAIAERDGVTVRRSGAAVAASSYTGCPQLLLQSADLVPGTWTVTVSYTSAESAGTSSKPRTVTVG